MCTNKNTKTKKVYKKSAIPLYAAAVLWLSRAFSGAALYSFRGIIKTGLLSLVVYCIFSLFFKGELQEISHVNSTEPKAKPNTPPTPPEPIPVTEAEIMVADGRKTLAEIRKSNNSIPNAVLSNRILNIEQTATKILYHISQNPQKASQIRKFLSYYLPTTLKLVQHYEKLWSQNIEGENINAAMHDIENIMIKMEIAFENQLDSLFKDVALDVSTDIAVLDNMLTMEGLLEQRNK